MESKFENKTKYSKELLMQFYLYHLNHSFLNSFLIVLSILLAIVQFYNYYYYQELLNLILGFAYLIAIGVIRFLNYFIIKLKSPKKIINLEPIYDYQFYEKHFIAKTTIEEKYFYQDIYKIKVDKDLVYLYIKRNSAVIVEKYSFTKGKGTDFISFITSVTKK